MTFLQPLFLAGLAAVTIPLLLHLISRWQSKRIDLGTTRFLLEILHDQAHRKRIRRWLLLVLRMAMIAILALLFARPSLPRTSRRDGDRMRLILVDRSASMAVRSGASGRLIDAAIVKARESMSELGPDARVEIAYFDSDVEPLSGNLSGLQAPKSLIASTRLVDAMRWARDRCLAYPNNRADVILITDLQRSGLDGADDIGMPPDVDVHLIDVGREVADNLAILDIRTPEGIRPPEKSLAISATIFNFGPADHVDIPVIVTARLGTAKHYVRKTVTVPSQQAVDVDAELVDLAPGRWEITLDVDSEDDLGGDNRRLTAVMIADPANVLVLDGGSKSRDETYFLRTALAAQRIDLETLSGRITADDQEETENTDGIRFRPEVVYLDEATSLPILSDYPLVIVADPGQMLAAEIESLHRFVSDGGGLIVFAGPRLAESAARDWEESGLAPGMISKPRRAGSVPYRMTTWDRDHPMLEPFADPQHGDLSRLAFQSAVPVKPSEQTIVLASFEPELPAITEHEVGKGRVVWCSVPATRQWGNWTASPLYLPIVQQMSADLLGQTGEGPVRQRVCGSEDLQKKNQILASSKTDSRSPGFYPDDQTLTVVNLPADESDITRMEPSEFYESFALVAPDSVATEASQEEKQKDSVSYDELWPWLVLLLLGLMVTEYWVAGRTPG